MNMRLAQFAAVLGIVTSSYGSFPTDFVNAQKRDVGVEFLVQHDVPLAETKRMLDRIEPIAIPEITMEEFLARTPKGVRTGRRIVEPPSELKEFDVRPNGVVRGGDGKAYEVKSEFLTTYPYNLVGKLVSDGGSCSGSVIGPHLALTAGHCVHPGKTGQIYRNVRFQPVSASRRMVWRIKSLRPPLLG
jgi:hypothetical protein